MEPGYLCNGRFSTTGQYVTTTYPVVFLRTGEKTHLRGDEFDFYWAGTATKPQINQDAVRLMKQLYGIDMEQTQYSKTFDKIPSPDIAISMGCDVACPFIGREFDDNWGMPDPAGKSHTEFVEVIREVEKKIKSL